MRKAHLGATPTSGHVLAISYGDTVLYSKRVDMPSATLQRMFDIEFIKSNNKHKVKVSI